MITFAASLFDVSGTYGAAETGEALFLAVVALIGSLALLRHMRDRQR